MIIPESIGIAWKHIIGLLGGRICFGAEGPDEIVNVDGRLVDDVDREKENPRIEVPATRRFLLHTIK